MLSTEKYFEVARFMGWVSVGCISIPEIPPGVIRNLQVVAESLPYEKIAEGAIGLGLVATVAGIICEIVNAKSSTNHKENHHVADRK
jgi:hypothetical protein